MVARYDDLESAAQGLFIEFFGEEVLIEPRNPGDAYTEPGPDLTRPSQRVQAILSASIDDQALKGALRGNEQIGGTRIAEQPTKLWITKQTATGLGYDLRRGDAIICLERERKPVYTVVRSYRSNQGDITLELAGENQ